MNSKKSIFISSLALVLFVCAAASSIVVLNRMNNFLLDDEGAIPVITEEPVEVKDILSSPEEVVVPEEPSEPENEEQTSESVSSAKKSTVYTSSYFSGSSFEARPGFSVIDENDVVWGEETKVDIFRTSYENGENVITVKSDNGDKIVAPGTDNSYTFKLKNTGNTVVQYWLDVDAYITPGEKMIPIEGRINRYDGEWIIGGAESWVDVPTLDGAADTGILGPGKYTYYTLDWRWLFEGGNDELDTLLGNLAAEEDITVTIVIKTIASASFGDVDDFPNDGITPPDTGDNSILSLWIALAVGSAVLVLILLVFLYREKKRSESEALKN